MSGFFKPYEGKRPYLFISYSHSQSPEVVDTIRLLHEDRWRLWYDEGIPAGGDWPKNIEQHLRQSAAVLFFLSKSALASQNCFSEIKTALALGRSVPVPPVRVMLVTVNFFVSMPVTVTVTVASVVPVRLRMLLSSVIGNVIVVVSAKSVRSTVPMTSWFMFSSVAVLPAT